MKKTIFLFAFFICATSVFAQENSTIQGKFFTTTPAKYFEQTIKPWKYQYTPIQASKESDSINKVGEIVFWRSLAVYDQKSKQYWQPKINFDIYADSDSAFCITQSAILKQNSDCYGINKGGDTFHVGYFILLNSSPCVACSSSDKIDYCRNIIKQLLKYVTNEDVSQWREVLNQLPIEKARFKELPNTNNHL